MVTHPNLTRKSSPSSIGIKNKTITKLFDIFMDRMVRLWNDKEITTTLTAPDTIRTAVGREKKLANKCGNVKNCVIFNRKPVQFLKHRNYTGVSYIPAALFRMHYNLCRLNLERLLKSISNFLNFIFKKEANWSANNLSDLRGGSVTSEALF